MRVRRLWCAGVVIQVVRVFCMGLCYVFAKQILSVSFVRLNSVVTLGYMDCWTSSCAVWRVFISQVFFA